MSTPEFYYGPEGYSGPFLSASEEPPEVESVDEYDQVHTDNNIRELTKKVAEINSYWNDAVLSPDYRKQRVAFEHLEILAAYVAEYAADIGLHVGLKCDEFDKESGL